MDQVERFEGYLLIVDKVASFCKDRGLSFSSRFTRFSVELEISGNTIPSSPALGFFAPEESENGD